MPLFELYRMTKQKLDSSNQNNPLCSTNISSSSENDVVCRNVEISMQDQLSKAKRNPFLNNLPVHTQNSRDKDIGNEVYRKMSLSQDDDNSMLPWLTYPMDQSLQNGYGCDFLNDFANPNDIPTSTMNDVNRFGSTQNGVRSKQVSSPMVADEATRHRAVNGQPANNKSGVVNFSHFLRPATSVKAANTNTNNNINNNNLQYKVVIDNMNKEHVPRSNHSVKPLCREDCSNDVTYLGEIANKEVKDSVTSIENVVASSSVCSGNRVERCLETRGMKRRHSETEESECHSEDVEEECLGVKRCGGVGRVGRGSKRSRAAEVHNLSERRRRDRINEKMRLLQELIPNCNKVDKASMLDEAIEYLKTLQLQVQVLSMGAGLYMPSMMLPTGIQAMHPAYMAHLSSMGFGMSMNGLSSGCPTVHGPHIHTPTFSGHLEPTTLHGMAASNHHFEGLSMSTPHAPLVPTTTPATELINVSTTTIANHVESLDSGITSSSKDPLQNISLTDDAQILNGCSSQ